MNSPIHFELGLTKNFVKRLIKDDSAFQFSKKIFPKYSFAKIREGLLRGPNIKTLKSSLIIPFFTWTLYNIEKQAWIFIIDNTKNVHGNNKNPDFQEKIKVKLDFDRIIGCNISLNFHFLHSQLSFLSKNMGSVSDEHGKRFRPDISKIEERYQGRWEPTMNTDNCWSLARNTPEFRYNRKGTAPKKTFSFQ